MKTLDNLLAFTPELWLLAGAIAVFLLARLVPGPWPRVAALATLALAFLGLMAQFKSTIVILDGAFQLDRYAMVLDVIILATAATALLLAGGEHPGGDARSGQVAGFMLLATLGAMLAISAAEMVALLVALELLAVNLYLIAALARYGAEAPQAGLGYLVLGLAGTAVLVYGLALLYGLTGETRLTEVGRALRGIQPGQPAELLALSLLIIGFAGKLGLTPVRWWTRRFELGVPVSALAFVAPLASIAGFGIFTRLLSSAFSASSIPYAGVLAAVAAVAMTGGNLLALGQTSIRRLLVYSTIAQGGYALVALVDLPRSGVSALLVFLASLALTYLCAFAGVVAYSRSVHSDAIRDLAGMSRTAPGAAIVLGIGLASLIGFPTLAGFFGKFFVIRAAVEAGFAWLAVVCVINLLLGALCYLRVIRVAFLEDPAYEVLPSRSDRPLQLAMVAGATGVVAFGLLLGPVLTAAGYGQQALSH
jgi:NADH-quinone oxidoreductase subunit N